MTADEPERSHEKFFDGVYEKDHDAFGHYQDWAGRYDRAVGEQDYQQPRRVAEVVSLLTPDKGSLILDAGCGTGLAGVALREAGYSRIDGCDYSPAMLDVARGTDVYGRLFEADLNATIDASDQSYDVVTAVGVFSFGLVVADSVIEMLRVLRPGGLLVLAMNDHFYEEGSVPAELDALVSRGAIDIVVRAHGEHLPGLGLEGWVIAATNAAGGRD